MKFIHFFQIQIFLLLGIFYLDGQKLVNPDFEYDVALEYSYTGSDQFFHVPNNINSIYVKVWGAGGSNNQIVGFPVRGGAGGFTEAILPVKSNQNFVVLVGSGGNIDLPNYGFAGEAQSSDGVGGGLTGLFSDSISQQSAYIIAGGGGGGDYNKGTSICGLITNAGIHGYNGNGTDHMLNESMKGSDTDLCDITFTSSGGGGYFGGGLHNEWILCEGSCSDVFGGGVGGSGYVHPLATYANISFRPNSNKDVLPNEPSNLPPMIEDSHYIDGVGEGGWNPTSHESIVVPGGNGLAIIQYKLIEEESENFIYVPNAFSPNGDLKNDIFFISSKDSNLIINSIQIFDRWGNLIFEKMDSMANLDQNGWDGKYQGQIMEQGVYLYYIKYTSSEGIQGETTGDFVLLK